MAVKSPATEPVSVDSSLRELAEAIAEFAAARIDFAELKRAVAVASSQGEVMRGEALKTLETLKAEGGLSGAAAAVVAGVIKAQFDAAAREDTDPGLFEDPREASQPKPRPAKAGARKIAATAKRAKARTGAQSTADAEPAEESPDHRTTQPIADEDRPRKPEPKAQASAFEKAPAAKSASAEAPAAIGPGSTLRGRYVLGKPIASGGLGVVYRAEDRFLAVTHAAPSSQLAIKVLKPEHLGRPSARARFCREALIARDMRHPNVLAVYDLDVENHVPFMTMELVDGINLRGWMETAAGRDVARPMAFAIIERLGRCLQHLHESGWVHRDVKPKNVLMAGANRLRLLDFGSATRLRETAPGGPGGTSASEAYASAETLRNESADARDDIYSFACVAVEVLSGRHPYEGRNAIHAKQAGQKPLLPDGLTGRQRRAFAGALQLERAERTADMSTVLKDLLPSRQPVASRTSRPAVLAATAAGAVLAVVIWIASEGWFPWQRQPTTETVAARTEVAAPTGSGASARGRQVEMASAETARADSAAAVKPKDAEIRKEQPGRSPETASPRAAETRDEQTSAGGVAEPTGARPSVTDTRSAAATAAPADAVSQPPAVAAEPQRERTTPFLANEYVAAEGDGAVRIGLAAMPATATENPYFWRTVGGTALDGEDYVGTNWVSVTVGDRGGEGIIFVSLVADALPEPDEFFDVELRWRDEASGVQKSASARVRLIDDD